MKPNELRINNIVLLDNKEYWPEVANIPMLITQITETESLKRGKWTYSVGLKELNQSAGYNDTYSQFIDFIKPIPLTEDWLLKMGFGKWENKKIWSYKSVLIYYHSKHMFCYGKSYSRTKLKYIHQVQNLIFALTGTELTINDK